MASLTFSPVEAAALGAIREFPRYRPDLEVHLEAFSLEEIDHALLVMQEHKLIVQWGGSLGEDRQFFLATGLGTQLHAEYTAHQLGKWLIGGARNAA